MTTFGDQVKEYGGAPVGSGRFSSPWATHYFVDYDNGSASNGGKAPDKALKTIEAAKDLAVGGDVIYIRPRAYQIAQGFRRYAEDITLATGGAGGSGVVDTNANMSFIGVTQRTASASDFLGVRWKVSGTNTVPFTVQAAGVHIENIGFFNEGTGNTIYFQNEATGRTMNGGDGPTIYNCAFKTKGPVCNNGGDGLQIVNCRFQMKHDGTGTSIQLDGRGTDSGAACARNVIKGCTFMGGNANNFATSPIIIQGSHYDLVIRDCYFANIPDTGDYIAFSGTNDGVVANCYFGAASSEADLASLAGGDTGIYSAGIYDELGIVTMTA